MTMAQDNPVQPGHVDSMLDYTLDRHTALRLVSRNKIASDGGLLRRWDGGDLEPGVFASLLALHNEGYIETHEPPAGSPRPGRQRPVRLTLRGMQLLSRFNLEHAQHTPDTAPPTKAGEHHAYRRPRAGTHRALGHQPEGQSSLRRSGPRRMADRPANGRVRPTG